MADGSEFTFKENISYTKFISTLARAKGMLVEAELGRLSGTEDDLTVESYEARMTDVKQVFFSFTFGSSCRSWFKCSINLEFFRNESYMALYDFRLKSSLMRQELMLWQFVLGMCMGNILHAALSFNLICSRLSSNYLYYTIYFLYQ